MEDGPGRDQRNRRHVAEGLEDGSKNTGLCVCDSVCKGVYVSVSVRVRVCECACVSVRACESVSARV